jgi:hypothetical protein
MFFITKIVNTNELVKLVDVLNTNTQDGYIDDQKLIDSDLWVVRVACSLRSDAGLVRAF